jgi:hypothetical protein
MMMCRFTVGKYYCLRLPDGRALGHVRVARLVDSWAEGPFTPAAAFEEFREIFEREARLRHQQIIPLWEEAADAIDALSIQLIEEGKGPILPHLRIYVEGNEAILAAPPTIP